MMFDITHAIASLRPNSSWRIHNEDYDKLEWLDDVQVKPTLEEINLEIARLQSEWDAKEYQRKRASEYPSFADQFDLLYHGGYDAWRAAIQTVKNKYPKG